MGNCLACFGPSPPPVVFTVCPIDCKQHEFGVAPRDLTETSTCQKCRMTKAQIDMRCRECRMGDHEWIQDFEPSPQAQHVPASVQPAGAPPVAQGVPVSGAPPVAQGVPVEVVVKCRHCGLRMQTGPNGVIYDDYYMYGGGYMSGMEMGLMLGIMGAHTNAYADPMYTDGYYGDDVGLGADEGFDDGGDFGGFE